MNEYLNTSRDQGGFPGQSHQTKKSTAEPSPKGIFVGAQSCKGNAKKTQRQAEKLLKIGIFCDFLCENFAFFAALHSLRSPLRWGLDLMQSPWAASVPRRERPVSGVDSVGFFAVRPMWSFDFSAAAVFLLCSSAFCGWLVAYALMQRRTAFSRYFVALMLLSAAYALGYGLELASPDLVQIKLALRLQYLGIPFLPLAWVGLAWSYLDSRGLPRLWWRTLLALSTLIFLVHQTNDLHHLYYVDLAFSRDGHLSITRIGKGPVYWLTVAYLNLSFGAGVLLFFRAWRQSKPIYHHQALCLLVGSCFPWLFHLAYQLGLSPDRLDLSPFGLAASGLLFAIASFRHGLLNVLPMARDLVFDGIAEGVIVIDDHHHIVDFNLAAKSFLPELGHHSIGLKLEELSGASVLAGLLEVHERFECPLVRDGQTKHLEIRSHRMMARGGKAVGKALLIQDITDKKALIEQLHQMATTDELTEVFNRRHLLDLSNRAIQLAQRHQSRLSMIIVDIDHFKALNDSQGHLAGDALLRQIASIFRARLRATDILGRYGGDEFIITLPGTDAPRAADLAGLLNRACLAECGATLSLGVAELDAGMPDFNALFWNADEALYRAKASGRNQVSVHLPAPTGQSPRGSLAPQE